jgi:FkbM family methyltransferase
MNKTGIKAIIQQNLQTYFNKFLIPFGLYAVSLRELDMIVKSKTQDISWDIKFVKDFSEVEQIQILKYLPDSYSQLRQDLFVLNELDYKEKGFFVEFGAADGKNLSNTYLLETNFNWTGILAEPAKVWHKSLYKNRPGSKIVRECVWTNTGSTFEFNETQSPELSTINSFTHFDDQGNMRTSGKKYSVNTISFNDLLAENNAPALMDYLSIDTEGSELEILSSLNFDKYKFRVITCEHNYSSNRERIEELLSQNGYTRVRTEISNFDDWYVLNL